MSENKKQQLVPRVRFPEFRDAGEWITVELGKLSRLLTERVGSAICTPYTITSGVGLISQEEKLGRTIAGNSLKNYLVLQENDFAYNKSATKAHPQGFIALYAGGERAAVPNSIFTCFRVNQNQVIPTFLDALFASNLHGKWLRTRIAVGARAHGSLQVSDNDLMATPVPLPSGTNSLEEQQKIADCLSSLDNLIAAESQKLDTLKTHKKGLMQQLFAREGETVPRLRFPEFRETGEWEKVSLQRVIEIASGQVDPTKPPYCDLPHVGGENIEAGTGKLLNLRTAKEDGVISGKYAFDEHDILYSKIRPALNKVAAPDISGVCSADVYPIRPCCEMLRREFLVYLLRSESFVKYATKHSGRGKIPKINREDLFAYDAMLPMPAEQEYIASFLSSLDERINLQSQKLEDLQNHKIGLMQQLFPTLDEVDA
ncbi:restriction endonuclease subunit S [Pseudomonas aeruginosa]|uniref:restriction endonuclease subunit S n=1 Tax=Pseudomonas aeruginosa TaxID=287 RepID=UPI000E322A6D|nr:restriction endonuclease subunit S [Pseudomonas aeruginosa]EJC9821312.1 restriction endonuclease subunit S [Pseudomonas aeruginosa]EJN1407684.1 restriction endonuclease subunit S [Pseudomonas aeruginosa]EJV1460633.1 restriction endonuclease subunit S [Pseudomonas aeruginosa]EKU3715134.1 restriction endonuclease subunit S [Pseudomonas aeruginosa]EKU8507834.1 restriction endonuclease subunit S [Pseudomonas aeruginosa]